MIVRAGYSAEESGSTASAVPDTRRWISFAFGVRSHVRTEEAEHLDEPDRYHLQSIIRISGAVPAGLMAGAIVTRRETEASRPPVVTSDVHLSGTLQSRLSTRPRDEDALLAAWSGKGGRVALLLTLSHAPAFWALPKEQRAATYLRLPDTGNDVETRRPDLLMKRIVHRLYRGPSPDSGWDYLAYFEMLPTDVAHVRARLTELRDRRDNKLWAHVARETELWMVKEPSRHSLRGSGAQSRRLSTVGASSAGQPGTA